MTHKGRIDAPAAKILFLERQNHSHVIDAVSQFMDTIGAPCPELRRDVVEHGNGRCLSATGQRKMQHRTVDHDGCVERITQQMTLTRFEHRNSAGCVGNRSEQHGRVAGHVVNGFTAGFHHFRTCDADEACIGAQLFGSQNERRTVNVGTLLGRADKEKWSSRDRLGMGSHAKVGPSDGIVRTPRPHGNARNLPVADGPGCRG